MPTDPLDTPYTAPARSSFRQRLGPGGLSSLALSLLSAVFLLGLPVFWRLRQVLKGAKEEDIPNSDAILVLGRKLVADQPTAVFQARLTRAAELWHLRQAPRILVAGGITGKASLSEADAGRRWLLEQGLPPEAILVEDRSQHTLENLFWVREMKQAKGWSTLILVSDPLHLARAGAMAGKLGMKVHCAPASACPPQSGTWGWWSRALSEAFFLHWYRTGFAYSHLIRSRKQLARVT